MNISRTALVTHTALDMYRLVHDVPSYPKFLSWCSDAEVHEQTDRLQVATLGVSLGGISQQFTTRNRLVNGEQLTMNLVEGPFRQLTGEWVFKALGEEGSKISLSLNFEVSSGLVSSAFGHGFSHIADRLVKDFCQRAEAVYSGP